MKPLLLVLLCGGAFAQANLTIASASLAADGRTFTLVMSAGSLLPSSGITGCFALHGGNVNSNIAGVGTASGNTIIFQSAAPFNAGENPTVDMLTAAQGCAITSGASTPQGQTGVAATNSSEWHGCGNLPLARFEGSPLLNVDVDGTGYPSVCIWNSSGGAISVNATGSEVQLWGLQYNNAWTLLQDGVAVGARTKGDASTTWKMYSLASGLSGSHLYRIVASSASASYQTVMLSQVRFVGGAPAGPQPTPTLPIMTVCGDSIANFTGGGSAPDDMTGYDWFLSATSIGAAVQGYSISGQTVSPVLAGQCPSRTVLIGGAKAKLLVHQGGANDAYYSTPIGNVTTPNTFTGDLVSEILNSAPNATASLVREVVPNTLTSATVTDQYRAAQAVAAAYANAHGAPTCFYHTAGWISISPSGAYPLDTIDGVHYNIAPSITAIHGAGRIANLEAPIFAPYLVGGASYTISGPSGGTVGTASTFTVTLSGGAQFVASPAETIVLSDGGNGGTFTSAFGSGTSPVTFTPTSGTSFTFTYTPAVGGRFTLTATAGQDCWTNPTGVSYTSTGNSGVPPTVVSYSVLFGTQSYNLAGSTRNRLPWQITGIRVVFSEPVAAGTAASLSGVAATGFSGLGTTTLTWTFSPISSGNFTTTLAGSGPNALMDSSANGLGGGTGYSQAFKVLWGDATDDGVVNSADLVLVNGARTGAFNRFADLNGDGVVDANDVAIAKARIGATLP